jgi:hypothetical protein
MEARADMDDESWHAANELEPDRLTPELLNRCGRQHKAARGSRYSRGSRAADEGEHG